MIKISTLLKNSSLVAGNKINEDIIPGPQAVKMLVSYSKALQVIHCENFKTCFIVLN